MGARTKRTRDRFLWLWLLLALPVSFMGKTGLAQSGPSQNAGPDAQGFEVVIIRPNNSGANGGAWGVNQNKYSAKNTPLAHVILQAYSGEMFASLERLKGAPSWVMDDPYDIIAKPGEAVVARWRDLKQAQQIAIVAPLLRLMLAERCKLAVHMEPTEIQGYELVIGKHGSKMKEAIANEPAPAGRYVTFESGWMMVPMHAGADGRQSTTYLQITMTELVNFFSLGGTPVVDHTGLAGKYDFELPMLDVAPPSSDGDSGTTPQLKTDSTRLFDWSAIGLMVRPIKVPSKNLVIDHIERPSAN